jgi:hypothetical protein
VSAARIFLVVGGVATVLDRAGLRPLGFEPVIILLTSIHFHYAGFVLPLLTGLAAREQPGPMATLTGIAVVTGIPLLAAGITANQVGWGPSLECAAAWLMAAGGMLAAWLHLRLARRSSWSRRVRVLWLIAALSLAFGMVLAALYGSRSFLPLVWLDIPWMRAVHGTINALGFAATGLTAWTLAKRRVV